ncbi:hypothetical protein DICA3_E02080 [Diutina catenulata]
MSDGTSASSSEESSSDDEPQLLVAKPVYVAKETSKPQERADTAPVAEPVHVVTAAVDNEGETVDDTDDVDPELEYQQWQARETARYQRDMGLDS